MNKDIMDKRDKTLQKKMELIYWSCVIAMIGILILIRCIDKDIIKIVLFVAYGMLAILTTCSVKKELSRRIKRSGTPSKILRNSSFIAALAMMVEFICIGMLTIIAPQVYLIVGYVIVMLFTNKLLLHRIESWNIAGFDDFSSCGMMKCCSENISCLVCERYNKELKVRLENELMKANYHGLIDEKGIFEAPSPAEWGKSEVEEFIRIEKAMYPDITEFEIIQYLKSISRIYEAELDDVINDVQGKINC